jgi:endoglucanase
MNPRRRLLTSISLGLALPVAALAPGGAHAGPALRLNDREYFAMPGLDVMVFQDIYPEGHQGGVGIIQNGVRVASNGDLRLEPTPGQWQPVPVQLQRAVDKRSSEIVATLAYPDPSKDRKGFNPIDYPTDLKFTYKVRVRAEGGAVRIVVDLAEPLPKAWIGRVGFNLELFPGALFGKTFYLDQQAGAFPRQPNGPVRTDERGAVQPIAFGSGKRLVIAPESATQRMTIESQKAPLELYDGRTNHQNGWFVVRSPIPEGATTAAVEWIVTPSAVPGWRYQPVVHVSQVGYHPAQQKIAVIELDASEASPPGAAALLRIGADGRPEKVLAAAPRAFGPFLRYRYLQFDFSKVAREGVYVVEYGKARTAPFRIARDVFKRDVWQPTLEYFLPVQMCHMRVNEKYKVWHGLCHLDDALMAPVNLNHFDGYVQGDSTLSKWKPLEPVPGLNVGGWHDAGDDDLRIDSQAGEVYILSLAYEAFGVRLDSTSIDQGRRLVEIRQPDGKPDLLQQIEHGALGVIGAYKSLGRLYRGMISPTNAQYVMVGDVSNQTDNLVFDPKLRGDQRSAGRSGKRDDRMVFTEKNPASEWAAIAGIAAAARVLKGYNDGLAADCLRAAEELWRADRPVTAQTADKKVHAAIELYLTTRKDEYRREVVQGEGVIRAHVATLGWAVGRALPLIADSGLTAAVRGAVAAHAKEVAAAEKRNPFGVPYEPVIWGAGWGIQKFGVDQYFLHTGFPDLVSREPMLSALNFVLGCHPGESTASFASGVGARSMTTAYGYNRADWSYIPGGVVSGTALIRPDFPELKDFPFLWQQAEYVLGGGASNFMFLVLAADQLLKGP